jgi:DNA-binding FadR family transcriptional regulator
MRELPGGRSRAGARLSFVHLRKRVGCSRRCSLGHALEYHAAILDAIRAADAEQARRAMHDHIEQTRDDLRAYVLKAEPSGQAA